MQKFHTQNVSEELVEKLKKMGMPIAEDCPDYLSFSKGEAVKIVPPSFAFVFDWLMSEKGVYIYGFRRFDLWRWEFATEWRFRIELEDISQEEVNGYMVNGNTWYEAAEKAIGKALELVEMLKL